MSHSITSIERGQEFLDSKANELNANKPKTVDIHDYLSLEIPPQITLLSPWLLAASLVMIHAWRGVGKTFFTLNLAYAIASGGKFLKFEASESRKVLYIDGEMPGAALQTRLAGIVTNNSKEPPPGYFTIYTIDQQPNGIMPDLATVEGQGIIDSVIEPDTAVIVIDNLSCLARRGGKENEAESWLTIADWALRHRAQGRTIIFVHHSGKNGTQRGTSKKEDILDTVISLRHPRDYSPDHGAVFEVNFEKARGIYGDDTKPFEAKLKTDNEGNQQWEIKDAELKTYDQVVDLYQEGITSQAEIARELDINRSTVNRHIKKALESGDIERSKQ